MSVRKIIHVDMDSYFASIEMRDNPSLRALPIAVGGQPEKRGVIATANYHARRFGVHSAMASSRAIRLCPQLVILPVSMDKYRYESARIRAIFDEYTDKIEPLSLDEAYLDVTESTACHGSATLMAQEIRRRIYTTTGLTASAGISVNKFLAKVASDANKPNGQLVVEPDEVAAFVRQLPVARIPGVGKVTAKKLHAMGVTTCADLQQCTQEELIRRFGKFGLNLYERSRGIDNREVRTQRELKQISVEKTYANDIHGVDACVSELPELLLRLRERIDRKASGKEIRSAFVKIKFHDFRQTTLERSDISELDVRAYAELFRQAHARHAQPVRLIGVGVRFGAEPTQHNHQLRLWHGGGEKASPSNEHSL